MYFPLRKLRSNFLCRKHSEGCTFPVETWSGGPFWAPVRGAGKYYFTPGGEIGGKSAARAAGGPFNKCIFRGRKYTPPRLFFLRGYEKMLIGTPGGGRPGFRDLKKAPGGGDFGGKFPRISPKFGPILGPDFNEI